MKKIYIFCLLICSVSLINAQQPAQFSLYMLNTYGENPAAGGLDKTLVATAGLRAQWVGLQGSPQTQYINVSLPLSIISSGVGFQVVNENIGARSGLTAKVSYNFIKKIGDAQLSIGAAGGIIQGSIDGAKLRTPSGDYNQGVIDHQDKILNTASLRGIVTTFDAGVFFKAEKFDAGIFSGNLTEPTLSLTSQKVTEAKLKRHYSAFVATHLNVVSSLTIHPSVMLRSDGVQTQAEISMFLRYNDNFFLGGAFRGFSKTTQDAAVIFGGFNLSSKLTLAYAYDITVSTLKSATQGGHEIALKYNIGKEFGKGKLPPIIYSPRF
ncbi:MAG: PorP/SprF family type IX secretion system membrane protein [Saprospiraceae bacterium]|nr:PorP/SprF family type IX secretion system membrane protein [Saprospiraceae bacterium]